MRMAASWFGSIEAHRIQGCGAMIRARWRAPLGQTVKDCSPRGSSESRWAFGADSSVFRAGVRLKSAPHHSALSRRPGALLTRPPAL